MAGEGSPSTAYTAVLDTDGNGEPAPAMAVSGSGAAVEAVIDRRLLKLDQFHRVANREPATIDDFGVNP